MLRLRMWLRVLLGACLLANLRARRSLRAVLRAMMRGWRMSIVSIVSITRRGRWLRRTWRRAAG